MLSAQHLTSVSQFIEASFYKIAGHIICIEALDEWSSQFINDVMSRSRLALVSAENVEAIDCTVRISCNEPPRMPPFLETFDVPRGVCYTDWHSYYLSIDESLILVHAFPAKVAEVWIGDSPHARQQISLANVISYAMMAAMRRVGLYELHSAGVVEPTNNVAALIIGASNSGKSTLTTRLVSEGWGYLSDDMLLLNENQGKIKARGLRRRFSISPRVVEEWELPRLKDALSEPIASDPTKCYLDPRLAFPNSFIEQCIPSVLLFPLIIGEPSSRMEKISQSSAMMKLIDACAWARLDRAIAHDYLQVLASLARQSVGWVLYAGRDLMKKPGCAASLLSEHMME